MENTQTQTVSNDTAIYLMRDGHTTNAAGAVESIKGFRGIAKYPQFYKLPGEVRASIDKTGRFMGLGPDALSKAEQAIAAEMPDAAQLEEWARGWVLKLEEIAPGVERDELLQIAREGLQGLVEFHQLRNRVFDDRGIDRPCASALSDARKLYQARQFEQHGKALAELASGLQRDLAAAGISFELFAAYLDAQQPRRRRQK